MPRAIIHHGDNNDSADSEDEDLELGTIAQWGNADFDLNETHLALIYRGCLPKYKPSDSDDGAGAGHDLTVSSDTGNTELGLTNIAVQWGISRLVRKPRGVPSLFGTAKTAKTVLVGFVRVMQLHKPRQVDQGQMSGQEQPGVTARLSHHSRNTKSVAAGVDGLTPEAWKAISERVAKKVNTFIQFIKDDLKEDDEIPALPRAETGNQDNDSSASALTHLTRGWDVTLSSKFPTLAKDVELERLKRYNDWKSAVFEQMIDVVGYTLAELVGDTETLETVRSRLADLNTSLRQERAGWIDRKSRFFPQGMTPASVAVIPDKTKAKGKKHANTSARLSEDKAWLSTLEYSHLADFGKAMPAFFAGLAENPSLVSSLRAELDRQHSARDVMSVIVGGRLFEYLKNSSTDWEDDETKGKKKKKKGKNKKKGPGTDALTAEIGGVEIALSAQRPSAVRRARSLQSLFSRSVGLDSANDVDSDEYDTDSGIRGEKGAGDPAGPLISRFDRLAKKMAEDEAVDYGYESSDDSDLSGGA